MHFHNKLVIALRSVFSTYFLLVICLHLTPKKLRCESNEKVNFISLSFSFAFNDINYIIVCVCVGVIFFFVSFLFKITFRWITQQKHTFSLTLGISRSFHRKYAKINCSTFFYIFRCLHLLSLSFYIL